MSKALDKLPIERLRDCLQSFDFKTLFIEGLGWSNPPRTKPVTVELSGRIYQATAIAELSGVVAFLVSSLPERQERLAIHKQLSEQAHENLVIFLDHADKTTQSLWLWVKREGNKRYPREHLYVKGQPGDLFVSKIFGLVVDINELDENGAFPLAQLVDRMKSALDVERVTKKFFKEYDAQRLEFVGLIEGIPDDHERRWYASVLMNRLMFVWFLQRKLFLDGGNINYLTDKLAASIQSGPDCFYAKFLQALFFEGFAKAPEQRSHEARALVGDIRYLNGGLFLPHRIERAYGKAISIPDAAFENLFNLFASYSWNLDDTPGGLDNEINPDVLGYIFEKYINDQKAAGAYYTRPEITEYLCERTIHRLVLEKANAFLAPLNLDEDLDSLVPTLQRGNPANPLQRSVRRRRNAETGIPTQERGNEKTPQFQSLADLLLNLDASLCRELLFNILPKLSLLDPACGSGAFLVAAMKTLINIYSAVIGRIKFLNDKALLEQVTQWEKEHKSLAYFIKRRIITDNLFGVDLMEEATEIAKLRLFLALVASARTVDQLEPLPNIDFNILHGNSLIGLLRVEAHEYDSKQNDLFRKTYRQVLDEKNRLVDIYRHDTVSWAGDMDLSALKTNIETHKSEAQTTLDELLLDQWDRAGIRFEETIFSSPVGKGENKSKKRKLKLTDIQALHPFHWGFEFDEILHLRGGFDAIITNPPWEIVKPQAKEFFQEHSELVTKNKMTIKDFEKEQDKLLQNREVRAAWLEYLSRFPHVSSWFRAAPQFKHQSAIVNGKKTGSDINLYKLFTEQCYNLLREGGECGIVIPSGIYTDLGAKGLRDMLFDETRVTGLFCFENNKEIFEGVHRSFKFVVMTFEKGGHTERFPAAFMRHEVMELKGFPGEIGLPLSVELIRRLSPDSHSVMEFKSDLDIRIAEKMLQFPLLGEKLEGTWNLVLTREFDMTNDSHLFKTEPGMGRLPMIEGKMAHQFEVGYSAFRYWIVEQEGRGALLGKNPDIGKLLDYQKYRCAFRRIARNTDQRTFISTIIPPNIFLAESFNYVIGESMGIHEQIFLVAILNSFVLDNYIRQSVSANLNMFFAYQTPVPRLTAADPRFAPIVTRAARLICTAPEFDDLAKAVGLTPQPGVGELAAEVGRNKPAPAGVSGKTTGQVPETVVARPYSGLQPNLNSTVLGVEAGYSRDSGNETVPSVSRAWPAPTKTKATFGTTEPIERARLRAELDGLIAHLYGLTEAEFAHILTTFPLVAEPVKIAALNAYRDVERGLIT